STMRGLVILIAAWVTMAVIARPHEPRFVPQVPGPLPPVNDPCQAMIGSDDVAPDRGPSSLLGRNRVHGPALPLACEHEALVTFFGNLGALPAIAADAFGAEIGQEAT